MRRTQPEPITHVVTMHVTQSEVEKLERYGKHYGSGGFQGLIARVLRRSVITRLLPLSTNLLRVKRTR